MNRLIFFLFLFVICTISTAGTINPKNSDNQYKEYASKFECVLKLITKNDKKITSCSSAVIIKPKWILTAAHIVHNKTDKIYVIINNKEYLIEQTFIPKDFNPNKIGYNDIALGKLSDINIVNIKYPDLYNEFNEKNKICDIVGWGLGGTFDKGSTFDDDGIRAGTNRISSVEKHILICNATGNDDKSPLEILISHGDSGGGLFINNKLAGINSLVMSSDGKPDSSWTDEGGHTRVSKFVSWIDEIIQNNE
jgi:hypothetical protein